MALRKAYSILNFIARDTFMVWVKVLTGLSAGPYA
jgi:hypothetical protein